VWLCVCARERERERESGFEDDSRTDINSLTVAVVKSLQGSAVLNSLKGKRKRGGLKRDKEKKYKQRSLLNAKTKRKKMLRGGSLPSGTITKLER